MRPSDPAETRFRAWIGESVSGPWPHIFHANGK